ncbi:MAG: pilin [Patescibacteria group bacterium]
MLKKIYKLPILLITMFVCIVTIGFNPKTVFALYQGTIESGSLVECKSPSQCHQSVCPQGTVKDIVAGCVAYGFLCCKPEQQQPQQATPENDCMGFCVPPSLCEPGSWPAPALSDPSSDGSCEAVPNAVCCGVQIVTPQGGSPTEPEAGTGTAAGASDENLSSAADTCTEPGTGLRFPCPLGGGTTIPQIIGRILYWMVGVSGSLLLLMFVYGGAMFILAGDSSEKAGKAQKILTNALIGLVIILGSYLALNYVISGLAGAAS